MTIDLWQINKCILIFIFFKKEVEVFKMPSFILFIFKLFLFFLKRERKSSSIMLIIILLITIFAKFPFRNKQLFSFSSH